MGGIIITLTRGMGGPTYRKLAVVPCVWEACYSAVGVSVLKTLSLDTRVCAVATFSR